MKKQLTLATIALLAGFGNSYAAEFDVEIINLTRGSWFTPFLVSAHPSHTHLFKAGNAASENLQAMAEGGDISGLTNDLDGLGAINVTNPAGGLLAPGTRTTASFNTNYAPANKRLSIVSMILPSNDGFMGLDAIKIPRKPGVYTYDIDIYDAGTEANDEIKGGGAPGVAGFPAPGPVADATGTGGTGVNATAEGFVHIHPGVLGDDNLSGGNSDIVNTFNRWMNPAIRVVVKVHHRRH
jgi:hypothetical protein